MSVVARDRAVTRPLDVTGVAATLVRYPDLAAALRAAGAPGV